MQCSTCDPLPEPFPDLLLLGCLVLSEVFFRVERCSRNVDSAWSEQNVHPLGAEDSNPDTLSSGAFLNMLVNVLRFLTIRLPGASGESLPPLR